MPIYVWFLLFLAGLTGGFIDSIAGGGGLVTVPALLAVGLPPQVALGTNKLQSSFGTLIAVVRYARAGLLRTPWLWLAVVAALFSSMAGAWAVSALDTTLLKKLIPWLLAAVAVYTMLNRKFGLTAGEQRVAPVVFALLAGAALGFYDGFFGPGAGSFWTVAVVTLLGLDLRTATGYTKTANLASNVGALGIFLMHDAVHFGAGGAMIAGQLVGARLGSGLVVKKGAQFIRPVFLTVVAALTAKLFWDLLAGE
jgi:uncharacterized membrane protein YfcA